MAPSTLDWSQAGKSLRWRGFRQEGNEAVHEWRGGANQPNWAPGRRRSLSQEKICLHRPWGQTLDANSQLGANLAYYKL